MSVWTMDQVYAVSRLYATATIARWSIDPAGKAIEATAGKLAHALTVEAQALAVDIHPADVDFRTEDADEFTVTMHARWAPKTTEVELVGGPNDGTRHTVQDIRQPFVVPLMAPVTAWERETDDIPEPSRRGVYELGGWFEAERVWAFDWIGVRTR